MEYLRDEIEQIIGEQKIDRARFFEASKRSYGQIIMCIENAFVDKSKRWDNDIHWANTGSYRPNLKCVNAELKDWSSWMSNLPEIIPFPDDSVYLLLEDTKNYEPKYWLYEVFLSELVLVLGESELLDDFYIVSKKYDWLISLNHHDIISYVGENLKTAGIALDTI